MRRLLTGYAVVFNLRHHRSGHLFQNRYKSIVCQEDSYLLELVRYIHLNPLRAGLVDTLEALDSYAWCGHGVIMGKVRRDGQQADEVLQMFAQTIQSARLKYRSFVQDGIALGKRSDLTGGGLRRSQQENDPDDVEAYDERILGGGAFVEQILKYVEPTGMHATTTSLNELVCLVSRIFGVDSRALLSGSKLKELADARAAVCFVAIRKLGISGVLVAKMLTISRSGVVVAARRGESVYAHHPELQDVIEQVT